MALVSMGFHGFPMQQLPWVSIFIYTGFHGFPTISTVWKPGGVLLGGLVDVLDSMMMAMLTVGLYRIVESAAGVALIGFTLQVDGLVLGRRGHVMLSLVSFLVLKSGLEKPMSSRRRVDV